MKKKLVKFLAMGLALTMGLAADRLIIAPGNFRMPVADRNDLCIIMIQAVLVV